MAAIQKSHSNITERLDRKSSALNTKYNYIINK